MSDLLWEQYQTYLKMVKPIDNQPMSFEEYKKSIAFLQGELVWNWWSRSPHL